MMNSLRWHKNIILVTVLLVVWFTVSLGAGVLFREWLDGNCSPVGNAPFGFWMLSLIGSLMILTYAIIRKDPVLFVGHILGATIYIRNLMLLKKHA